MNGRWFEVLYRREFSPGFSFSVCRRLTPMPGEREFFVVKNLRSSGVEVPEESIIILAEWDLEPIDTQAA